MKEKQKYYVKSEEIPFFNEYSPLAIIPALLFWGLTVVVLQPSLDNLSPINSFFVICGLLFLLVVWFLLCCLIDYLNKVENKKQWVEI